MSLRPFRALVAVLALGAALILPGSAAAEPGWQTLSLGAGGAAPAPWSLLAQAWRVLSSLWGDEGCMIDPSGRCAPVASTSDIGCGIDPNGLRAPEAATTPSDIGCGIDPDGLSAGATSPEGQSDIGCIIDPDG